MKHLLFTSLFFVVATITNAQEPMIKKLYAEGGFGPATRNGIMGETGLRAVFKNNWTATVSYYIMEANAKNMPSDYEQGYTILLFIPIPDEIPVTELKFVNIAAGKSFDLGKKTWITTDLGASFGSGDKLTFTPQPVVNDIFGKTSNYKARKTSESLVGGLVRADFNWAFLRFMGMGVGVFGSFNSIQTQVGGEIKLMIGMLNPRKK